MKIKLRNTLLMIYATFLYMFGFMSQKDLYNFIGNINPALRMKLEKEE